MSHRHEPSQTNGAVTDVFARADLKHWLSIAGFGLVYALLALAVGNSYYQLIMTVVLVWAVMGLAWNLLSGYSGLISFGHAAFFGLGAYFVALAQINWGLTPWLGIPIAGLLGGLAGLIVGLPTFRLRGHYFALAMLAYPLALLYVFEWLGYQEVAVPMVREEPVAYMQFADGRVYVYIALALALTAMILTRVLERSRYGLSLTAIKQDETAAEAAGIDALAWKLKAIGLSGAMAGAIGGFYAVVQLVVTPLSVFGVLVSAQALIVAMFGGVGTVWGPVIGALVLVPLSAYLDAEYAEALPGIQGVIYGVAIIAVITMAPEGVFWKVRDVLRPRRRPSDTPRVVGASQADGAGNAAGDAAGTSDAAGADNTTGAGDAVGADDTAGTSDTAGAHDTAGASVLSDADTRAPSGATLLEIRGLTKSFGGLKAVSHVDIDVREGEILGIIGPNGAGKTTLFNLLNGFVPADAGDVIFAGERISGRAPNRICRAGIARTFQVVKPFRRMTVADNVIVGAYVHTSTDYAARAAAARALEDVGLADSSHLVAGGISNKALRLMELARALASAPRVLLLDEIFAGLSHTEIAELMIVIRRLNERGITIVIIEHTMHAMVQLVDRFVVLDHGAVLAEGPPDRVTRDPAVVEAYLGKKWLTANA